MTWNCSVSRGLLACCLLVACGDPSAQDDDTEVAHDEESLSSSSSSLQTALVTVRGTNRDDTRWGTLLADRIEGLAGNDRLFGLSGKDWLVGGAGNDELRGGVGDDRLEGGEGDDRLTGGAGNDQLEGGSGVDRAYYLGLQSDYAIAEVESGFTIQPKNPWLTFLEGTDTLVGVESVVFGDGSELSLAPAALVLTAPATLAAQESTAVAVGDFTVEGSTSEVLNTTLSVSHGVLILTGSDGLSGDVDGSDGNLELIGDAAHLEAALDGLIYQSLSNYDGPDQLWVALGSADILTIAATAITVTAVDDAPLLILPPSRTFYAPQPATLGSFVVADSDSENLKAQISVSNGTLDLGMTTEPLVLDVVDGDGSDGALTISGSAQAVQASLDAVIYQSLIQDGEDVLTVTVSDATSEITLSSNLFIQSDAPIISATPCGSAGTFPSGSCCSGLIKDANGRCQVSGCKTLGQTGVQATNGTTTCCFGLALVSGTCRTPTLTRTCTLLGGVPSSNTPCCKGLTKSSSQGTCQRDSLTQCSASQITSCCYGSSTNACSCYCPSPYYKGT